MTSQENVSLEGNSVTNSGYDLYISNNSKVEYSEITPCYNENGELINSVAIAELVTDEPAEAIFNGTAAQFAEAMGATSTTDKNVAIQCSDANVIYGDAQNPSNGLNAIIAGIKPLESTLHGYELIENETSEYAMLIVRSNASADGAYYYEFVNQDGVVLKATGNAGTGLDGMFYPEAGALYSNGVVFNVDGGTLNAANKNYFGLYRAGVNNLIVADLKWFEQDGFSTTIYYDTKDGNCLDDAHLADNIAGNVFTGHLVPMAWDSNKDKFVEADATSTGFYLKNADGDYIVAQKYVTNGSLSDQSTYSFTTVSATTLAKNLSRSEDGLETLKYFGEFKAEYSYAVTNPKILEAIDAIRVKVGNDYIKLGRLDLTADKPILISLGSNEVVQPWDLLKKGKFYTVELVSSANDNLKNKKGYKLGIYDDDVNAGTWDWNDEKSWVKS